MTAPTEDPADPEATVLQRLAAIVGISAIAGAIGAVVVLAMLAVLLILVLGGGNPGTPPGTTSTTSTTSTTLSTTSTTAPGGPNEGLDELDNPGGLPGLDAEAALSLEEVEARGFADDDWTEPITPVDNGPSPQGQFRLLCTSSHLRFDDPIIFPEEPGAAHLHLFFGNTTVDGSTTDESLLEEGGSTCQGGPLNRSGYWVPAMLDGKGSTVLPTVITLYYKSHRPEETNALPQLVRMLAGSIADTEGAPLPSFDYGEHLSWGCYDPALGVATRLRSVIPGTAGSAPCPASMPIRASIQFPQCMAVDAGGEPLLNSPNYLDHTYRLGSGGPGSSPYENQKSPCPASHPFRVPQITYLIDWPNLGPAVAAWRLSSDAPDTPTPGGSLHGDWWGGWIDEAIEVWQENCMEASRNCSQGQTGTDRRFDPLRGTNMGLGGRNQTYVGPPVVPLP